MAKTDDVPGPSVNLGVSREHARNLLEHIEWLLRSEGSSSTGKNN